MSRRNKERERGPLTPKKKSSGIFGSPGMASFDQLVAILQFSAPSIEAAGSFQRAKELGVLNLHGFNEEQILSLIPRSRGGTLEGPEVEADWNEMVASASASNGTILNELREGYAALGLNKSGN